MVAPHNLVEWMTDWMNKWYINECIYHYIHPLRNTGHIWNTPHPLPPSLLLSWIFYLQQHAHQTLWRHSLVLMVAGDTHPSCLGSSCVWGRRMCVYMWMNVQVSEQVYTRVYMHVHGHPSLNSHTYFIPIFLKILTRIMGLLFRVSFSLPHLKSGSS